MPLTLNNTNTLTADNIIVSGTDISQIYATKTELGDIDTANSSSIHANTDAIAALNSKQLQNFNNINAINDDLTNNYQTNTVLATNFYNKTEIDATFTNYYTSTQIDTNLSTNYQTNAQLAVNYYNKSEIDTNLSTDFQTNTQIQTNYYNKTEVDALVGAGSGYTDTEINNLLDLRVPKSDFTNRFSANPIIDCSAPTVIHSGLTLNNSTINISPVAGLLFSNQTGGGDKVLAEFKNATSYITLQGDKIFCNNTSDDAIKQLDLNPNGGGYKMSGKIAVPTGGLVVENTADANLSFTVRNTDNYITFNNDNIDCYNSVGDTGRILQLNNNANQYVKSHSLLIDTGIETLTGGYTLDVVDSAIIRQNLKVDGDIDLTTDLNFDGENANINNANGLTFYKNTTDASNVLTVKNAQGYLKFNSFNINAYNTSNDSSSLLLLNTANGNGVYCLSLGIGAIQGANKLNVSGGNANFGGTSSFQNTSTFNGDIYVNNSGRIFQRSDANNSLNVISTNEINFSLQANRTTDPTTGTIALQLNDTNGITLNRAVTNNLTFNSIGNLTAEADLITWGKMKFQNSSEFREVLDTQYKLYIRNGDTLGDINLTVGLESSTPEIKITDGKVKMNNLEITQETISTVDQIQFLNTDAGGEFAFYFGSVSVPNDVFSISPGGILVNGDIEYTGSLIPSSDKRLKKDIKELDQKKAVELVKYIVPKTYHFIDDRQQGKSCCGFIANDFLSKKVPDEWQNIVKEGKDGYLKFDYTSCVPILWSALQHALKRIDKLEKEINRLKGKGKGESD